MSAMILKHGGQPEVMRSRLFVSLKDKLLVFATAQAIRVRTPCDTPLLGFTHRQKDWVIRGV